MRLRVLHTTQYRYQSAVVQAQHLAHLRPLDLLGQTVQSHHLSITPQPSHSTVSTDAFGNWRLFFALQEPHEELLVAADSLVDTGPPKPTETAHHTPWEVLRDQMLYRAQAPFCAASEFVYASPYVPRSDTFADLARPLFTPKRSVLEACTDLMGQLHRDLVYETASTGVNTPALEALAQGKGVCQDFAHIMIGCLRSLGLPARYVSGYLLTQPPEGQPRLIGADASHAWVSVYAGGDWHDFDPTNNRWGTGRPGEDYITLTWGRDFGDVSPLRGVIQGGSAHQLSVGVTVAPPDAFPASA
ncbi:MAG: hypothetical protein RJA09_753 [Pseudomonadota bacterium]|jgi:transglutaminase-like putative cysteine protease